MLKEPPVIVDSKPGHAPSSCSGFIMPENHHIPNAMKHIRITCLTAFAALLLTSCAGDDTTVDPPLASPSVILRDLQLSTLFIDTDTVDVVAGQDKSPNDPVTLPLDVRVRVLGEDDLSEVRCTVTLDGRTQVLLSLPLRSVGNGIWMASMPLSMRRGDVGDYRVEVSATDRGGLGSNIAVSKLRVVYGSQPPVLLEVFAPDTLEIQSTVFTAVVAVRVTDPSGLGDIKQVFFNSFLPNGQPAQGNPFILRDDGHAGSGDDVAGDGIYSLRISVPPTAMRGVYRFEFRALDYSNLSSNLLIHTILMN
jgi:hypothetical protein